MLKRLLRKMVLAALRPLFGIWEQLGEEDLPRFANAPKNLKIEKPRRVLCDTRRVFVGDDVGFGPGLLLMTIEQYPTTPMQNPEGPARFRQVFDPRITIGNRVTATSNLTISAMQDITIEDDVMFSSNVFICDGFHGYENANEPYKYQKMGRIAPIAIKRGCWIGQNVVVMPGVTIGELAIVGANSVVTRNIPPRSIAVGAPARVIKRWDENIGKWVPVDERA